MRQARYMPTESMLALQPKAFGLLFATNESVDDPGIDDNGVAVIDICGPLMHHKSFFFDSYDEIKERASAAIAAGAKAIVLSIDSPGGLVSGAFDTARELRAMCAASGCELRAHIGGTGASAAYALASACSWIGVSQTAIVGSIGVIDTLVDATEQNKMFGLNVRLVASGIRKPDGNPDQPLSEGAIKATQERVNEVAEMFFGLVESNGWSNADDLRAMQGAVVTGEQAVAIGLASEIATLQQATASSGASSETTNGDNNMATPMEDAIESLRSLAESEDEEEAKRAKVALAALEDSEEEKEEEKPAAKAEEDEEKPAAKAEEDEEKKEEASAKNVALQALAEVHRMKAEREAEKQESARAKLIASRPDFSEELVAILQTSDMATVKKMVATLPKGKNVRKTAKNIAAASTVIGTVGADANNDRASRLEPEAKASLDRMMGLATDTKGIKHDGNRMIFGASVPAKD